MTQDVRWVQRFTNYLKAFDELKEGVQLGGTRELSKLEKQGIIQRVGRVIYRAGSTAYADVPARGTRS